MSTTELQLTPVDALSPDSLSVADFTPYGIHDWPGRIAATVLLQGCPWSCTYCAGPEMQDSRAEGKVSWREVLDQLEVRRGMVDAVVFSGGEPTRQPGLAAAVRQVKARGFAVGLSTAGAYPGRLAAVLPALDWVGIDIKAAPDGYADITGKETSGYKAWTSLELVQHSGIDYEVRVTVDPTVHTREDVFETVRQVIRRGAHAPVLQQARVAGTSPEYRRALAGRGLFDVIRHDDLPDLARR
ncbi:anaerobic ribonucleoside-triphosphate reductase activating protein [Demequina sp.]|uniref:anaerobic ribonucleoside-triphosphate reductase activating protein n=1 Tax=Demequina sp. TaxID=2050685 RepID=UPI0025ED1108|nr:anaerobic ribonucleoside-triphosphate reductase activating protein [Demequina sp.]